MHSDKRFAFLNNIAQFYAITDKSNDNDNNNKSNNGNTLIGDKCCVSENGTSANSDNSRSSAINNDKNSKNNSSNLHDINNNDAYTHKSIDHCDSESDDDEKLLPSKDRFTFHFWNKTKSPVNLNEIKLFFKNYSHSDELVSTHNKNDNNNENDDNNNKNNNSATNISNGSTKNNARNNSLQNSFNTTTSLVDDRRKPLLKL